jgi:hypothetical protein
VLTHALHMCAAVSCRFLIPLGIALGADLTFSQFIFQNLIPVTLGNIVGGLVFMVSCCCMICNNSISTMSATCITCGHTVMQQQCCCLGLMVSKRAAVHALTYHLWRGEAADTSAVQIGWTDAQVVVAGVVLTARAGCAGLLQDLPRSIAVHSLPASKHLANYVRLFCLSASVLQGTASSIFYGAMGGAKKMSEAAAH